jgi:hypothetical protein
MVMLRRIAVVVCLGAGTALGAPAPDRLELKLGAGTFDPLVSVPLPPVPLRLEAEPASGYFIVQFREAIRSALLDTLRSIGAAPVGYLPDQAYLVRLPEGKAAVLRALPEVRWLGPVQPGWKISPDLGVRPYDDPTRRAEGRTTVTVDLFADEDLDEVAALAAATGAEVLRREAFADTRRAG